MDYSLISDGDLGIQLKAKEAEALALLTPKEGETLSSVNVTKAGEIDAECELMRGELDKRAKNASDAQTLRAKIQTDSANRKQPVGVLHQPTAEPEVKFLHKYAHKLEVYQGREEDAYKDGLFILGALTQDPDVRNELRSKAKEKYGMEFLALAEGVNSTGGYLVPVGFSNTIIMQQEAYGVARANADVITMPNEIYRVPRQRNGISNNITAYWGGENVSMTDASMLWDQTELKAKKLYALAKYSNELKEDAIIDMADRIAKSAAIQLSYKEDQAWLNGAGEATNGNIQGIITGIAGISSAKGKITCASATTWATVTDADIMSALAVIPAFPGMNVKIYCHKSAYYQVFRRLVRAGGGNTIVNLADGGSMFNYDGIPVIMTQVLPSATATNTVFAVIGDPKMTTMFGERRQMTVQLSDQAGTAFTDDQTWVKITERIDINNFSLGDSSLAGGMVTLQTHS
jgi:HK97 family phage major capsid protein